MDELPLGVAIIVTEGRIQPYAVYIPGLKTYTPAGEQHIWRFCKTLAEAHAVVKAATGRGA